MATITLSSKSNHITAKILDRGELQASLPVMKGGFLGLSLTGAHLGYGAQWIVLAAPHAPRLLDAMMDARAVVLAEGNRLGRRNQSLGQLPLVGGATLEIQASPAGVVLVVRSPMDAITGGPVSLTLDGEDAAKLARAARWHMEGYQPASRSEASLNALALATTRL